MKNKNKEKLNPVFVRIPESLFKQMKIYVTFNENVSQQSFITDAIKKYLKEVNK